MKYWRHAKLIKKIKNTDIFETLKHSKNYLSASIATQAISFISIPIFTRLFTQADYGIIAVFSSYVGIMTVILSLNSHTAIGRYYYEKKDDFSEFVGTTLIFVSLIFGLIVLIYILFYKKVMDLIQLPGLLPIYLLFGCLFAVIYSIYQQILVPQKKSKEFSLISIAQGYGGFGIAVLFVYLLKENRYLGQIRATLLISFIFSIYFIIRLRRYSKLSFKIKHIKYILTYSIPLIPYVLSGVILAQFDRIMINNIIDSASAGLYSFGYNIGMSLLLVISAMQGAFIPDFFKFLDNGEYKRLDSLFGKVFSIVTLAAFGLVLFAREIVLILADKKFHAGLSVVPAVVIGYVFYTMFIVYGMYPGYVKKTIFTSVVTLIAGISNILLNIVFIPKYGYIAAAYTTLASYLIMFLLSWIVSKIVLRQRVTPLWIIWKPTLIMFSFMGFVYFLSTLNLSSVLFFVIKLVVLLSFTSIIFWREIRTVLSSDK